MTTDEFVAIGKALGWTVRSAATALGVGKSEIQRYRTGERPITAELARRIRSLSPKVGYKEEGTLVSFTHFRGQRNNNVHATLQIVPVAANRHEEPTIMLTAELVPPIVARQARAAFVATVQVKDPAGTVRELWTERAVTLRVPRVQRERTTEAHL